MVSTKLSLIILFFIIYPTIILFFLTKNLPLQTIPTLIPYFFILISYNPFFPTILPLFYIISYFSAYYPTTLFSYNPTIIYIIKQDIRIYVPYSRPNGWTDWAEIFCGHSWVAGGLKNPIFFFQNFFFHEQRRALQLVFIIIITFIDFFT